MFKKMLEFVEGKREKYFAKEEKQNSMTENDGR